jgi:Fe-S-cluster containining protein
MCCVAPHDQAGFADVTAADQRRLGARVVRLHVVGGAMRTQWRTQRSGPFAGWEMCTCRMLRGSVGRRVSCRIYDRRPRVCRAAVRPGDTVCRALRAAMSARGVEPDVAD